MNCVLYARVSTDKQAEKDLSIPAQLQAMREHARRAGWTVVKEFVEPGASAKTAQRPELQKLLALLSQSDARADIVLVHKIDRLARNVYDHATIKAMLHQKGVRLASVVENVDDSVPGQLVENIMASIAQFYSSNLAEEVKKGMRQKVLKGGWPHLPPRGYMLVRSDSERSARVEPHPTLSTVIRAAFERYATGWLSLKAVAALLAKDGVRSSDGRPLSPSRVRHLLGNPFYAGRVHWKDLQVSGVHEPLVSAALFERVQKMLRTRSKFPGAKGSVQGFPLRGLAICASCRGHMTASYHKRRFGYYHCARRGYNKALCAARSYCPAGKARADIERICRALTLTADVAARIRWAAERIVRRQAEISNRRRQHLEIRRTKLLSKELRLTNAFVGEEISPTAYSASAKATQRELAAVENALARADHRPDTVMARVDELLGRALSVQELHDELNEPRQVELLRAVFETVVLEEAGVVGFTLHAPFGTILQTASSSSSRAAKGSSTPNQIGRQLAEHVFADTPDGPRSAA